MHTSRIDDLARCNNHKNEKGPCDDSRMRSAASRSGCRDIKSGKLRGYGVTGAHRAVNAPDIPTIAEAGLPGYQAVQWFGVLAPAATPREVITKLHDAVARAVQDPDVKKHFIEDGGDPIGGTPQQFAELIRSDLAKWAKVITDAGIKAE